MHIVCSVPQLVGCLTQDPSETQEPSEKAPNDVVMPKFSNGQTPLQGCKQNEKLVRQILESHESCLKVKHR